MNRLLLSKLEIDSLDLAAAMRPLLSAFCVSPPLHARFLNMLSLLEHIGSRKIAASAGEASWGQARLKHLAEESRHAYFFKRAAEKIAGRPLDYSRRDTLAAASARRYMGRLDANVARSLGNQALPLAYLYMSLIVEIRAVWAYRLYRTVLVERNCRISLQPVLAEEELHLDEMLAQLNDYDPNASARMAVFCNFEDTAFRRLWRAVEEESTGLHVAAE